MAYGAGSNKTSKAKSIVSVSKERTKPLSKPMDIRNSTTSTGFVPPKTNFRGSQNDEQLILNRDVFNKTAFNNTIDTSFTELDQAPPDLSFFDPNLATVNDFFNIYQNLFYQIPKYGETNSHEFLVVESTAYSNVIENQEQIDALLEEIVDLREQNLQLQLDVNELVGLKATLDQAIRESGEGSSLEDILQEEADLGSEQSNSSSDLLGTTSDGSTLPSQGGSTGGGGGGGGGGIPGVTQGLTDASQQNTGGDPLPPNPFGPGGGSNANPGMPKL